LGGAQLNATANVPGSFVYTPLAGTVLTAGTNQVLSATFTPVDTTNYSTATATVHINVLEVLPPVINFANCSMSTNGFQLQFLGQPGHRISVLVTEDFVGWTELGSLGLVDSLGTFVDSKALGKTNRFYKIREAGP
jgi:hypothetical protein